MSLNVTLYEVLQCDCGKRHILDKEIWAGNITHNVGTIAARVILVRKVTLYQILWHPEEILGTSPILRADSLVEFLERGVKGLEKDQIKLEKLNPKNGWGSYIGLLDFTREYLDMCLANPDAAVSTST